MGSKKKQVIGYKYFLGMHMIICHGPVDSVQKIIVGDREAWSGNVTASSDITIAASELFGGAKKEGGISGTVQVLMGESTQAKNSYLQSKIQTLVPAFRGVLSLVLKQCYVCAMSPYPKPWAIKVKRIPAKTWYSAKAEINGSANPIHVIYETLTNKDWGMGIDPALLNDTKFRTAADTCFSESLGVSMIISNQDSIEKFIYEVLGHCNGMFFIEPSTGKFAVKLLREDYVVASLPSYNESNVVSLESFDRPTYSEIVNEVVVSYRPQGGITDDSVTVQDLASIQAQGGIVSHSATYPGIDTAANASRIAMRDLRQKSTPLARIKIKVNKTGWNLALGDVFKFSWSEHGLVDIICRVLSINSGGISAGEIIVECAEDIFGLPSTTYVGNQSNLWTDPVGTPAQFTNRYVREATYFELNDILTPTSFTALTPTSAYLVGSAEETNQYCQGYELWTSSVADAASKLKRDFAQPTPYGTLAATLNKTTTSLALTNLSTSFPIGQVGQYCHIDNEIVRLDSINYTTGIVTFARGCLDTVPETHSAGAKFLFTEAARSFDTFEWASGATIYARMCMRTANGVFALASAADTSIAMVGRQAKPYPPGNFRINTLQYPTNVTFPVTLSWAHRDRTQQLTRPIIDTSAGNIGPEATVAYKVRTRVAGGSYTEYDVAGTSYVISTTATVPLLMHMEGLDNGVVFTEETGKAVTVAGDAKTKTSVAKIGTSSAYFDGVGDYLSLAYSSSFDIIGDFTFECFIYPTATPGAFGNIFFNLSANDGTYSGLRLGLTNGRNLVIQARNSSNTANVWANSYNAVPLNTWTHIALSRAGGVYYVFFDGVLIYSNTVSTAALLTGATCYIGMKHPASSSETPYTGYIDELRLVNGMATRTSAFTPPSAPLDLTISQVLEVEVESIKGTNRSLQKHYHSFTVTA